MRQVLREKKKKKCRDPGSNQGPLDLQSNALPTELSRLVNTIMATYMYMYMCMCMYNKLHVHALYLGLKASAAMWTLAPVWARKWATTPDCRSRSWSFNYTKFMMTIVLANVCVFVDCTSWGYVRPVSRIETTFALVGSATWIIWQNYAYYVKSQNANFLVLIRQCIL